MKILFVPVLKKLAAILVSVLPLSDVGTWLLKSSLWTKFAIVSSTTLVLIWFFVKYLPNRRNRVAKERRSHVFFRKMPLLPLGDNASFLARLWRNCLLSTDWLIGMVIPEAKEASAQHLQSRAAVRVRSRKRVVGLEPDAGPQRSLQRLFPGRGSSRHHN